MTEFGMVNRVVTTFTKGLLAVLLLGLVGGAPADAQGWEFEAPRPSSQELKGIYMFGPGDAWNPVGPIGGYTLAEIQFVDANNGWTCDIAGRIYHSTDGG